MTRLYDSLFPSQDCLHASGDNLGRTPAVVCWRREGKAGPNAWFTDSNLNEAHTIETQHKIAWLLEPREYRESAYDYVERRRAEFTHVLTYDADLMRAGFALPYMFGGTRIAPPDWNVEHRKFALVSIVASPKRQTAGHRLRHEVIARTKLDAYGPEYKPIERKLDALAPYRFSVAIEACRRDWWFTEALLDCFLTGTVPVYWGCPSVGKIFDAKGIIQVESLAEIRDVVESLTPALYDSMRKHVAENFKRAQQYHLTEDWLQRMYPDLFDERAE